MAQSGFDFDDGFKPVFAEHAPGTWEPDDMPDDQLAAFLTKAAEKLQSLAGPVRPLFSAGVEHASKSASGSRYLHGATDEQCSAFISHCERNLKSACPGIEYKVRSGRRSKEVAMYVEDAGTITVFERVSGDFHATYDARRATVFLDSYKDTKEQFYAPYNTWRSAYSADKLAYAGKKVASVPTFSFNGREYVCTAKMYNGPSIECEAWSVCLAEDWKGPTYNYETQNNAVDEGRIERSDRRGLIVNVRGQLCVLDAGASFYDDDARDTPIYSQSEPDQEDDTDLSDCDEIEEEDEALVC